MEPAPASVVRCAICQSPVETGEPTVACPACQAPYHAECWDAVGGCAIYGCRRVPPTEGRRSLEIPPAYWGQETKPCPACGVMIMAAAIRCRSCGATFQSARPEAPHEYHQRRALADESAGLQRATLLLFAACLLPCSAPLAAVAGGLWYLARRQSVDRLPALYPALARIGIAVGFGQTVWLAAAVAMYAIHKAG